MKKVIESKNSVKLDKYISINPIIWKKFKTEIKVIKNAKEILWEKIKNSEDKTFLKKLLEFKQR